MHNVRYNFTQKGQIKFIKPNQTLLMLWSRQCFWRVESPHGFPQPRLDHWIIQANIVPQYLLMEQIMTCAWKLRVETTLHLAQGPWSSIFVSPHKTSQGCAIEFPKPLVWAWAFRHSIKFMCLGPSIVYGASHAKWGIVAYEHIFHIG